MGIFKRFKTARSQNSTTNIPQASDPEMVPPDQMANDLERLLAFEKKIKGREAVTEAGKAATQQELALKLKNPFRGE